MRWGMDVTYPVRVESAGGRYHFKDDWECADTQVATFEFEGNKSFIWEGRSCNGFQTEGLSRGVTFHGENGSVLIDDHSYTVYDQKMKVVKKIDDKSEQSTIDTTGPGDRLDLFHLTNFVECMRSRKTPNANIGEAQSSVMLCHLANIAYRVGHTLRCDPTTVASSTIRRAGALGPHLRTGLGAGGLEGVFAVIGARPSHGTGLTFGGT